MYLSFNKEFKIDKVSEVSLSIPSNIAIFPSNAAFTRGDKYQFVFPCSSVLFNK